MKKIWIIIILLSLGFTKFVDVGTPVIQAVCRVTTHTGTQTEGFVTLINGGYNGVQPNGFYFYQDEIYNSRKLFDLKSRQFKDFYKRAKAVYFIAHTWNGNIYSKKSANKIAVDSLGKQLIYTEEITHRYKMFDSIPLFQELPRSYFLNYEEANTNTKKVAMCDVERFEIVANPKEQWLTKISNALQIFERDNSGEYSTGDVPELFWAHDIIKDPKLLETLVKNYSDYKWY